LKRSCSGRAHHGRRKVVEDETLIRELVAEELEEAGYTVIIANNADQAIAILEARQDIHLVFTDIDMPGSMDGLKLAAAVRDDRWPPVHIIITQVRFGRSKSRRTRFLFPSRMFENMS
jgi:CheY-like chemotaxis protein